MTGTFVEIPLTTPRMQMRWLLRAFYFGCVRCSARRVAEDTGMHAYAVDQLLKQMIARAQKLELRVIDPPKDTIEKLLVIMTSNYCRSP
jgi:hypothetical protein